MANITKFDVFLSHNSKDTPQVEKIAKWLEKHDIRVWLDKWELRPGLPWQREIEKGILDSISVAIFIGPVGLGPWHETEMRAALNKSVRQECPVIPVLLPGCPEEPKNSIFLKEYTSIDFRNGLDDDESRQRLLWGITGKKPNFYPYPIQGKLHGVPELPPHFLERPAALNIIKSWIIDEETQTIGITSAKKIGVHGMGGIGKTVLAAALVREPQCREKFPDGIFWIVLGRSPDLVSRQIQLAKSISGKKEDFTDVQGGKARLGELLTNRACLIILDDAWEMRHISEFNILSPSSQLLITTRNANLIVGLGAKGHNLDLLTIEQALALLSFWSGKLVVPGQADEIIRECGYLPLAISMVGAMLRGKPVKRWEGVFKRLKSAKLDKIGYDIAGYDYPDMFAALHVSLQALKTDLRERYLDFAVFPEDTPIPIATLYTFWGEKGLDKLDVDEAVDTFVDRSLIQVDGKNRIMLHDLQRDYTITQAGDEFPELHQRLIDAYDGLISTSSTSETLGYGKNEKTYLWKDGPNDGYFFKYIPWHLFKAERKETLKRLLLHFPWLQAKLDKCNINLLISDYHLLSPDNELKLVQHAMRLSTHVLSKDPTDLAFQLHGRLSSYALPGIKNLLGDAKKRSACWPRPLTSSLSSAGDVLVKTLTGHFDGVNSVSITSDGKKVVSASLDKTLKVWDLETGNDLMTLAGHNNKVNSVAVFPNRLFAVSASNDNTLIIWDLTTGNKKRILYGHSSNVVTVAVLPDGKRVVSGSLDKTVKVWDIHTAKSLATFVGHRSQVNSVAVMPNSRYVLSGSDNTLKIWDLTTNEEVKTLRIDGVGIESIAVTGDGRHAVLALFDGALKVLNLRNGKEVSTLTGHSYGINSVSLTPDGLFAVTASHDSLMKVWDLSIGKELAVLRGHSSNVYSVAITPDGHYAVSGSFDRTLKIWDLNSTEQSTKISSHAKMVGHIVVTPDNRYAITASNDKTIKVWNLRTGEEHRTLTGHTDYVLRLGVSSDSRRLISSSADSTINIWDLEKGKILNSRKLDSGYAGAVAMIPNKYQALLDLPDQTIKVWNFDTKDDPITIIHDSHVSRYMVVTPNGRHLISASGSYLHIWDLFTGKEIGTFKRHGNLINSISVTPNSRFAVTASDDFTIKILDIKSFRDEIMTFFGHSAVVGSAIVTPDYRFIVSVSWDNSIKIWSLLTGRLVTTCYTDAELHSCAVSADGKTVIAGDRVGNVHFLRLEMHN